MLNTALSTCAEVCPLYQAPSFVFIAQKEDQPLPDQRLVGVCSTANPDRVVEG
jgi:hypothetical protein